MKHRPLSADKSMRMAAQIANEFRSVAIALGKEPKSVLEDLAKKWASQEKKKVVEKWASKAG